MIDIGSVVNGKYRLVRLLGDGGMGAVYEAVHAVLGTHVAVKVLHPELNRRTGLVERFLQEARVSAQIRSPHVVQVADVDRTPEGHAYIVMELLEGEPLSAVLDRQRRIPVPVACEYTVQILEALEAAHALGVIHRDLKPENVFVTFTAGKPVLKLIDFGIAKARRTDVQKNLTVAGVVMGTAEYMAPEQAYSADKVDARADLYAVGVMLYEMIAGVRPVSGDDAKIIALKVERGEARPLVQAAPGTPPELAGLVHRAMAARPQLRFANATEMRLALQAIQGRRTPSRVDGGRTPASATVELGAHPAAAASSPSYGGEPAHASGIHSEPDSPHVDTIRAPPIATALHASPYGGAMMPPPAPAPHRPRRPSGASWIALVALPLLIGAAVVAILVGTGTWASSASAPGATISEPSAGPAPSVAPAAASAAANDPAGGPASPGAPIPTLAPARPGAPAAARPVTGGRPSPAPSVTAGAAGADASVPGFGFPAGFPSGLPPFPTALPSAIAIPPGFPTALPTALPSALPTAFPSVLPAWPATPPEPPAPPSSARTSDPAY